MVEKIRKTSEVYGISRDLPLNYVERDNVDAVLLNNLTRDKHVVIYGSSKQGKTSLRKHCLAEDDYIVISCLNTMSLSDLHGSMLKAAGYRIEQTTTRTVGGQTKYTAQFKGKGKVPLVSEMEVGANYERQTNDGSQSVTARLELDLFDVNDVITAFKEIEFSSFIILEDFHYLPVETQKNFAFALKAFHENASLCFVVVGVWREKNRLVYYNGDLANRVVSIDADAWSPDELRQVVHEGEALLNVTFDDHFREQIIANSFDGVYLVQESCLKACQLQNIYETCKENTIVGHNLDPRAIIKDIVDEQAGRYSAFLTNFSEGFQATDLEMYKWVLYAVISSELDMLERGLRRSAIASAIKDKHPVGSALNEGNVTQALLNTASLQVQKNIRPIILDYDQTTKVLNIVDRSFLIWLAYQEKTELLSDIGINS